MTVSLTPVFSLQVNDFLSGAAPLNLTMRLGDHMMLIQVRVVELDVRATSWLPLPDVTTVE